MSQVPAVPEPAGDRLPATPLRGPAAPADPWSGGLPDPWRVDAAQSEPAREVIDRIVDAVVERIEERVLDELERRGRHDWRVV